MSRAPIDRVEWNRVVLTHPQLPIAAKAVVMLLGTHLDWKTRMGHGYRSVELLEEELAGQRAEDTIGRDLSEAVRLGLLVVIADPSPGRSCVYRAAVPTGEPAAPAGDLLIDLRSPAANRSSPGPTSGCDPPGEEPESFEHPDPRPFEHPDPRPTYPVDPPGRTTRTPLPPRGDRPLLAIVAGNPGGTTPSAGDLVDVPIPKHVELVASGLVAALPDELPSRVVRRWERRVAVQVARLLAGRWETSDLVDAVIAPAWSGVANPGAVLVSRLQALPARPPAPVQQAWCGQCDQNRQRESPDGRVFRCPACHPLVTRAAPF